MSKIINNQQEGFDHRQKWKCIHFRETLTVPGSTRIPHGSTLGGLPSQVVDVLTSMQLTSRKLFWQLSWHLAFVSPPHWILWLKPSYSFSTSASTKPMRVLTGLPAIPLVGRYGTSAPPALITPAMSICIQWGVESKSTNSRKKPAAVHEPAARACAPNRRLDREKQGKRAFKPNWSSCLMRRNERR